MFETSKFLFVLENFLLEPFYLSLDASDYEDALRMIGQMAIVVEG